MPLRASALVLLGLSSAASASPTLKLLASIDGGPPRPGWVYARVGQRVVLHADLKPRVPAELSWFKLEPEDEAVDNTQPSFHFHPIRYRRIELTGCKGRESCPADVRPSLRRPVAACPGAGTLAFQVTARLPDGTELASPGLETTESGGPGRSVMRVTLRKDDSYLGHLTELFNTPYIFGSSGPEGRHQTDLLIGSDCADLLVYGRRRLGFAAAYTSSWQLDRQAPEIARAIRQDARGVALAPSGAPIRFGAGAAEVTPGDVLHFPGTRHVAALYEDRPPLGVLDRNDWMLHTCWAPPTIEPIGDSRCASMPVRVLRFR